MIPPRRSPNFSKQEALLGISNRQYVEEQEKSYCVQGGARVIIPVHLLRTRSIILTLRGTNNPPKNHRGKLIVDITNS